MLDGGGLEGVRGVLIGCVGVILIWYIDSWVDMVNWRWC